MSPAGRAAAATGTTGRAPGPRVGSRPSRAGASGCWLLAALLALLPASPASADEERYDVYASGDSSLSVGASTTTSITPPSGGGSEAGPATGEAPGGGGPAAPTLFQLMAQTCTQAPGSIGCAQVASLALACSFGACDATSQGATAPRGTSAQPEPVSLTTTDVQRLMVSGSGLTRQPPGPQALVTKPVIVYTSDTPQILTTTVAATPITITVTPTSYHWDWGDATTQTTTHPGAPWPHHTISHTYTTTARDVTITLTTTWTATWTHPDGTTRTVEGTLTTTETAPPFDLVRTTTYLTDDAEHAQGH